MKTINDWFETLPEPYKSEALKEMREEMSDFEVENLEDALEHGIYWLMSKKGFGYWNRVWSGVYRGIITPEEP